MPTRKIATIAAAGTIALLALGGTAFAAGADDTPAPRPPAATTAPATPSPVMEREVEHGRVVLEPHGGAPVTSTPRSAAGVEVEVEHGHVVVKPHGHDRADGDHGRDGDHGSDD